jgi:hypothetical protein
MTKAKSLVDVLVRNVFVQIPIDDERYELITAIGRKWHNRKVGQDSLLPSGDASVNLSISSIVETCQRGADALAAESFCSTHGGLSRLDLDRSRRFYASIDRDQYRECIRAETEAKAASALVTTLLGNLYERLLVENTHSVRMSNQRQKEHSP